MVYLILGSLAVCAVVECIHHGEIFRPLRAWLEARGGFVSDLVACPYCLSHWVAGALAVVICILRGSILEWPLWWLGLTRASNLINDLTHEFCRTPKYGDFDNDGTEPSGEP